MLSLPGLRSGSPADSSHSSHSTKSSDYDNGDEKEPEEKIKFQSGVPVQCILTGNRDPQCLSVVLLSDGNDDNNDISAKNTLVLESRYVDSFNKHQFYILPSGEIRYPSKYPDYWQKSYLVRVTDERKDKIITEFCGGRSRYVLTS
jgi:hypothetical protein